MAQGPKQGIAKTIRGAVETYDGFASTLSTPETALSLNKKWRFASLETPYIEYTSLTGRRAKFLVLRFVRAMAGPRA